LWKICIFKIMMYLLETKLPEKKSILFALTYIYGINKKTSYLICKKMGFTINFKVKDITQEQSNNILKTLNYSRILLGNELKKFKMVSVKKMISIKSYRGLRKLKGFPVRGQRTHTNAKSARKRNKSSIL